MKCIKAIKPGKDIEVGTIKRVDDKTAYNLVGPIWQYVSKSEWKSLFKKNVEQTETPKVKENRGSSHKQKSKKNK